MDMNGVPRQTTGGMELPRAVRDRPNHNAREGLWGEDQ